MVAQTLKLSLSGLSKFDDTCAMQQRFDFPGEREVLWTEGPSSILATSAHTHCGCIKW